MSEKFATTRYSAGGGKSAPARAFTPAQVTEDAPARIWAAVRESLRQRLDEAKFEHWIAGLQYVAIVDDEVLVSAPGEFERDRVIAAYGHMINQAWAAADPLKRTLAIESRDRISRDVLALSAPAEAEDASAEEDEAIDLLEGGEPAAAAAPRLARRNDRLQTLDNFVVGDSNVVAHNIARRVAAGAGVSGQVVTIIGPHGVGKTHLLRGVETAIAAERGESSVLYVCAEDFLVAFVEGVKRKDTTDLRTMMRSADVVLMDDFQFICSKPGTLVEFFCHVRANVAKGCTVVIACDQPLAGLEMLDDRMRDELMGGVSATMDLPDRALRLDLVRATLKTFSDKDPRFVFPDEWASILADRVPASGRVICGVISSVYFATTDANRPLTWEAVEREINQKVGAAPARPPKIETIKDVTARLYNISRQDLESQCRKRTFSMPRQYAMYLSRKMTKCSYPLIGRMFGGRDHTTVLFAYRKLSKMIQSNATVAEELRQLEARILADPRNQR